MRQSIDDLFPLLLDSVSSKQAIKQYQDAWNNEEIMESLWRPYDAQVIGHVAEKGFYNLCDVPCSNANAVKNSRFNNYFVHWINKENKDQLIQLRQLNSNTDITVTEELKELDNDDSNSISPDSPQPEEPRET